MKDLSEVIENIWLQCDVPQCSSVHLGVFSEPYLQKIYSGEKTMESRFTMNKTAPYGRIRSGDIVIIKRSSGPVEGFFLTGCVVQYDLSKVPIAQLKEKYGKQLCVDDAFWEKKKNCRYAVLFDIMNLKRLSPFTIQKRGMQTWISWRVDEHDVEKHKF